MSRAVNHFHGLLYQSMEKTPSAKLTEFKFLVFKFNNEKGRNNRN